MTIEYLVEVSLYKAIILQTIRPYMAAEGSFSTFFVIFGTFFAQVFSTPTTTKHLLGLLSVTRGQKMIFFLLCTLVTSSNNV